MREIKFRAFDHDEKIMIYEICSWEGEHGELQTFNYREKGHVCACTNLKSIMQFIGVKDKNEKEIYEGDIISRTDLNTAIFQVKWRQYDCSFTSVSKLGKDRYIDFKDIKNFEIIGNIYENPELLK